jgi:hypothetical protein
LETIVSARKVKMYLIAANHKETALLLWMKTTFQDYLSIMPLVFDITHSFATPLYGFDQQILLEATQNERTFMNDRKSVVDWDHVVMDFLRRHEKAGGNFMAVAIVLNTEGLYDDINKDDDENQAPKPTSTRQPSTPPPIRRETQRHGNDPHRIKLGFVLQSQNSASKDPGQAPNAKSTTNKVTSRNEKEKQAVAEPRPWPAVYLRSSTRMSSNPGRGSTATGSSSGMGLISSMRSIASSARGSASALDTNLTSQHMDVSPRTRFRKTPSVKRFSLLSHGNVFEYETEPSEKPSWPHSEWGRLRSFLDDMSSGALSSSNMETDGTLPPPSAAFTRNGDSKAHASIYDGPMAVTFHPDGEDPEEAAATAATTMDARVGIFSSEFGKQLWDPTSIPSGGTTSTNAASTFHAVNLNNFMWMIGTYATTNGRIKLLFTRHLCLMLTQSTLPPFFKYSYGKRRRISMAPPKVSWYCGY